MRPIDMLGMGPTRRAVVVDDGWIVTVTPPPILGLKGNSLRLTNDQYERYQAWLHTNTILIYHALPELTNAEREILMTGMSSEDFEEATRPERIGGDGEPY